MDLVNGVVRFADTGSEPRRYWPGIRDLGPTGDVDVREIRAAAWMRWAIDTRLEGVEPGCEFQVIRSSVVVCYWERRKDQ